MQSIWKNSDPGYMSNKFFEQIVFPPLPKAVIFQPSQWEKNKVSSAYNSHEVFEKFWCVPNTDWVTLKNCVGCHNATKPLKNIIEDLVGCD